MKPHRPTTYSSASAFHSNSVQSQRSKWTYSGCSWCSHGLQVRNSRNPSSHLIFFPVTVLINSAPQSPEVLLAGSGLPIGFPLQFANELRDRILSVSKMGGVVPSDISSVLGNANQVGSATNDSVQSVDSQVDLVKSTAESKQDHVERHVPQ